MSIGSILYWSEAQIFFRELGSPDLAHGHFTAAVMMEPTVAQVWECCCFEICDTLCRTL